MLGRPPSLRLSPLDCHALLTVLFVSSPRPPPLLARRSRDEISSIRQQRDPVEGVRKLLLDSGLAQPADLKAIEKVGGAAGWLAAGVVGWWLV